jgi:hypothetical protein
LNAQRGQASCLPATHLPPLNTESALGFNIRLSLSFDFNYEEKKTKQNIENKTKQNKAREK